MIDTILYYCLDFGVHYNIHEMQEQFKARQERAVINQQQFEYDMREQSEGIRRSTMVDDEE